MNSAPAASVESASGPLASADCDMTEWKPLQRTTCGHYCNDLYQVALRHMGGALVHLNIRRRDGAPIMRDWRHFQQIKNELIGEECEAFELYPPESRKVDDTNSYHLWGFAPGFRVFDCLARGLGRGQAILPSGENRGSFGTIRYSGMEKLI
jgi:hypothetical protein